MILSAIVNSKGYFDPKTVEVIMAFDTCVQCGCKRKKVPTSVKFKKKNINIHFVSCPCTPVISHDELDIEHSIIVMLNEEGIVSEINLTP